MRGQTSHLDPDVLAEFRAGLITGRRGRPIAAHLADCARCAALGDRLAELSALLAAIPAPTMPDSVAQRLDTVLAAEVARQDEAKRAGVGRSRDRKRAPRPTRRPRLQPVMLRVLGPAAAVVALAAGGYGLSLIGGQSTSSSATAGPAAAPAPVPPAAHLSAVPAAGTARALAPAIQPLLGILPSGPDLLRAALGKQLEAALRAAQAARSAQAPSAPLRACIQRLTSGISPGTLKLVESARFAGQQAVVIVASSGDGYVAWVVAPGWVAPGCSATSAGVLARTTLPGISAP
jgi:hypothetical protein